MAPPTSAPSKPSEEASRHWGHVGLTPSTMINMYTWKDKTKNKNKTEKEKQSGLKLLSTLEPLNS